MCAVRDRFWSLPDRSSFGRRGCLARHTAAERRGTKSNRRRRFAVWRRQAGLYRTSLATTRISRPIFHARHAAHSFQTADHRLHRQASTCRRSTTNWLVTRPLAPLHRRPQAKTQRWPQPLCVWRHENERKDTGDLASKATFGGDTCWRMITSAEHNLRNACTFGI